MKETKSPTVVWSRCDWNSAMEITTDAGEGLIVIAPFLPSPLVEKLGSEGFASKLERGQGSDWLVYFWRDPA